MRAKKAFSILHERSAFVLESPSRFPRHFMSNFLPAKH